MTITPMDQHDVARLPEFQPDGWRDIVTPYLSYLSSSYCLPVKCSYRGELAGIGAGISFGETGWLAHIIVRPEYRRRGIGSAIVEHLVGTLRSGGCRTISLVATDLGHPVYLRAGFAEQTHYVFYGRGEIEGRQAAESSGDDGSGLGSGSTIATFDESLADPVLQLDREVSGEDRGKLLAEGLHGSYVCTDGGRVTGFYAPGLGEGLIVACEPTAGATLMRMRLADADRAVLPAENLHGSELLTRCGFREVARAWRMVMGEGLRWQPHHLYNRIAGNLG